MQGELADQQGNPLDRAILKANRELLQAGPVFWVTFYGIVLILTIALGTTLMIGSVRDREIARSEKELDSTVRLLAAQFDRHIETFEAVPKSVANYLTARVNTPREFRELVASENFHRLLQEKRNESVDFSGVNVFDSDGNLVNSSERWPISPVNVSDRQFFQTFKAASDSPVILIQLVDSRVSKGQTIVVARKILSPNGSFLGVVTRSISPAVFEQFFSTLLVPDGFLALIHRDGSLLARYPKSDDALGSIFPDFSLIEQNSTDGTATTQMVSAGDQDEHFVSAKSLEHYPIYVAASEAGSAVSASWRQEIRTFVGGASLAALIVAVMLLAIVKLLREQHRRLDIAVNNMTQGLLLFDRSERMVLCNQRFLDMFQLSPEIVRPKCTLREIIQLRKDTGSFAGDVEEYCAKAAQELVSGQITLSEIPDGRWMQTVTKPIPGGGWVTTIEDVTDQHRNEERTVRLASYDTLTELPNRALFHSHLSKALETCSKDSQVAVLFLDIDEFKSVNDTLGHKVGDELLKSAARSLKGVADADEFVARLGGDEFAIVVPGIGEASQVLPLIQRIYDAIRPAHKCLSHQLTIDTSIGIALASDPGTTADEIVQNADLAMYDAKSAGKRTYRFFEAELEKKARDRRELEIELRKALEVGALDVHYQPILCLKTNRIVGCEALARWSHQERGFISPAVFIPIAERSGLIDELGEYILRKACEEAARWPKAMKLAVNVSPSQFKPGILALKVVAALAQSGLSPRQLELEITEAVLIEDDDTALKVLHELKSIGVRVALDDFGTGYSSLSYLRRFPFDKIKIDRSFINDLTQQDSSSSIVRAVVSLAVEHKMITTAEGVETERQREMLRDLNCDEMQGYLFSPGVSASELTRMIGAEAGGMGPLASPGDADTSQQVA